MTKKKGFTLLESMLAVAIFAVVGIVCLENYLLNISIAQKIIDQQTCVILARQKEFEYLKNPDNVPESGDFGSIDPEARYKIETSDITLSETVTVDSEVVFNFTVVRLIVEKHSSRISYPVLIKSAGDSSQ
ncbi:MAG TPA: type II secretion system protein [bacterium]|nr:type II secretion system protein [bacterium]HOL35307.1 type II secretion system protein [bacterium]HPP08644.1 type II secretion system protein [bacterium]